jgi:hypothetical protein
MSRSQYILLLSACVCLFVIGCSAVESGAPRKLLQGSEDVAQAATEGSTLPGPDGAVGSAAGIGICLCLDTEAPHVISAGIHCSFVVPFGKGFAFSA